MELKDLNYNEEHFLSTQIKWMIIHYKKMQLSNKETAKLVGQIYDRPTLSHQTVKAIWNKFHQTGNVENQWNPKGRPHALDDDDMKDLLHFVRQNPQKSVSEAKNFLNLPQCRQTINKALLENGLRAYRAPKKFFLCQRNEEKRYQFALRMERLTLNYWKKILFSDEASFSLVSSNGRIQVRRTQNQAYQEHAIQYTAQTGSLMVWGIISYQGLGPLVRIDMIEEGESTLNGDRYLTLLQRFLTRHYPALKDQKLIFQHDNAPSHRSRKIKSWLKNKGIKTLEWPPQSPDMNIIETVWNQIKFKLRGKVFRNKDELWKNLNKEWRKITPEFIQGLYESLPRRIQELRSSEGKQTKY